MQTAALAAAVTALLSGPATLPDPREPLPTRPAALAERLEATDAELGTAVGEWLASGGEPPRTRAPQTVSLLAIDQQRIVRLTARRPDLRRSVLRRLPDADRRDLETRSRALQSLFALAPGSLRSSIRTGPPLPPERLLRYYRAAQREFGVGWHVLAAVNLVETQFGRLRNTSVAGAQGPMQFIPSTWAAYGLGGDVRNTRDAIRGAANYLRASGAPRNYRRALFAYNPSTRYVEAVRRFAVVMARRPRAFYELYAWEVFLRGEEQVTGPGATTRGG